MRISDWSSDVCSSDLPESIPPRPKCLPQMIEMAEALGKDFCFVRVDLYEIDGHPLFGEMTFTPGSGFRRFEPKSFDVQYGTLWNFPIPKEYAGNPPRFWIHSRMASSSPSSVSGSLRLCKTGRASCRESVCQSSSVSV